MKRKVVLALALLVTTTGAVALSHKQDVPPQRTHKQLFARYGTHPDMKRLIGWRRAGLSGDRSQIPLLRAALKRADHELDVYTALNALARLDAQEALPDVEELIATLGDQDACAYARAVHLRLAAKANVDKITVLDARARAQAVMTTFQRGLNLDAVTWSETVRAESLLPPRTGHGRSHLEVSTATWALRELSDMIYQKQDKALVEAATQAGIRFDADAGAKLKLQIALLPQAKRIAWLVDHLSSLKGMTADDFYITQLAVDEGQPAAHAVVEKLQSMDQNREAYKTTVSAMDYYTSYYTALFDVLRGIGGKEYETLVAAYKADESKYIQHYAQMAYEDTKNGAGWQFEPGY